MQYKKIKEKRIFNLHLIRENFHFKKYEKILSLEIINPCQNTISRFYHDQSFEKLILVEYFVFHGIFFRDLSLFIIQHHKRLMIKM